MDHVIPEMTDPRGNNWPQPSRDEVMIHGKTAVMSSSAIDQLMVYSNTIPTAAYPGKMWRAAGSDGIQYLCWFGVVPGDSTRCTIEHRVLIEEDWKALMGVK